MHSRKITRLVLLGLGVLVFGIIIRLNTPLMDPNAAQTDISDIHVRTENGEILIQWTPPVNASIDFVQVSISDGESVQEKQIYDRSYAFRDGVHGTLYTVTLTAKYKDGTFGAPYQADALFLDDRLLPDLPLLTIDTIDGQDPTFAVAEKSPDIEVVPGTTIVDNEYVHGNLRITHSDQLNITTQVKIRVRGNTSAVATPKKPYRIVLSDAVDLLGRTPAKAGKEWILLNSGTNLNTYIGSYLATLCGEEWQPEMMFVNLMLNGDWKGCYYLIEPVSQETAGDYVSESGYIFEDDIYWWNEGGAYFRTDRQQYPFYAYTFKYPDVDNPRDIEIVRLQRYMQDFEDYLQAGDEHYLDYIDEASFAAWLLTRDIMGDGDPAGANMYFYKYDFDPRNPTSSKVKMGPLWDFDSAYITTDEWAYIRTIPQRHFIQLLDTDSFNQLYVKTWQDVSETLFDRISQHLTQLYEKQGAALDESRALDAARWRTVSPALSSDIEGALNWYKTRIDWINRELGIGG